MLVLPEAALAKRLCLQLEGGPEIVLTIPSTKKGEAYPVSGYYAESTDAYPVFGTLLVGARGDAGALALQKGRSLVTFDEFGGGATAFGGQNTTITFLFWNLSRGNLDVGDEGSAYENDTLRFVTVIDCATATPVP